MNRRQFILLMEEDNNGNDKNSHAVTKRECAAMRLLGREGWTSGVLQMCFHLSTEEAIRRHVQGSCGHEHPIPPIKNWRGDGTTEYKPEIGGD